MLPLISVFSELGWEAHKIDDQATCLVFLGIEIDSNNSQLRLPPNKLRSLKSELANLQGRKTYMKRELLSSIGQLNHAAKHGRSFLCCLIDLSSSLSGLHHLVRLNISARVDIAPWLTFGEDWNGVSLFIPPSPTVHFYTNASGSWCLLVTPMVPDRMAS